MIFDNKTTTSRTMWIIALMVIAILLISVVFLINKKNNILIYIILMFSLLMLAYKMIMLKYFRMEITDGFIYIIYYSPLKNRSDLTVMEQPIEKINFCKLEKSIMTHYICVVIKGDRTNKMFCYEVGLLSRNSITEINEAFSKVNNIQKTL